MSRTGPDNGSTDHAPHIVKFSGGRSSGMMLMNLLERRALRPERGDVIVFNNTSAEHPATYEFTRKMKTLAERAYNIPFFWIEYQSYEDSSRHGWQRNPSYRLVNEYPCSEENPHGYRYKGETFEEMISLNGFLPNMQNRVCTQTMKIFITNAFLTDWLAQKSGIERLGHYGDTARMTDEGVITVHRVHGGETPDHILLEKKAFVRNSLFIREQALWQDFTRSEVRINNDAIKDAVIGGKGQLFGDRAIEYVSCLGIRKDEEGRVGKIQARIDSAKRGKGQSLFQQPPGERILAPLVTENVSRQQVIDFWEGRKTWAFDLDLPSTGLYSNCVYCPLKGERKLLEIAKEELSGNAHTELTPASIDWWVNMERKYSRNLKEEKREITSEKAIEYIGFFGAAEEHVYQQIKEKALRGANMAGNIQAECLDEASHATCNCTD